MPLRLVDPVRAPSTFFAAAVVFYIIHKLLKRIYFCFMRKRIPISVSPSGQDTHACILLCRSGTTCAQYYPFPLLFHLSCKFELCLQLLIHKTPTLPLPLYIRCSLTVDEHSDPAVAPVVFIFSACFVEFLRHIDI